MAKKSSVKKTLSPVKLIIMAVIVIALVASVGLVKKNQENRSKAAFQPGYVVGPMLATTVTPGSYVCGTGDRAKVWYCKGPGNCAPGTTYGDWELVVDCKNAFGTNKSGVASTCYDWKTNNNGKIVHGLTYAAQCKKGGAVDANYNEKCSTFKFDSKGKCITNGISGVCGTIDNTCNVGTLAIDPTDIKDSNGKIVIVRWTCKGKNGGLSKGCSSISTCGNNANTCVRGKFNSSPADVVDPSIGKITYLWTCEGLTSSQKVNCKKIQNLAKANGVCGTTHNTCKIGKKVDAPSDNNGTTGKITYNWTCKGINGGANKSCSMTVYGKINGKCAVSANKCAQGTLSNNPADTSAKILWTCNGIQGGSNANCSILK